MGFLRLAIVLLLLGFGLTSRVYGQTLDIFDDLQVQIQTEDDPRILFKFTQSLITQGPGADSRRWIRAVWAESAVMGDFGPKTVTPDIRQQAIDLAGPMRMQREALDMQLDQITAETRKMANSPETIARIGAQFKALRNRAKQLGLIGVESRALREEAYWTYDLGNVTSSIKLQSEAAELLDQNPQTTPIDRLRLKIDMAMTLDVEGQSDRARQLYFDIEKGSRELNLRSMSITNYHEMGLHFSNSEAKADWKTAERYFSQAIAMARDFDDAWTVAKSTSALAPLYSKLGRHHEAVQAGRSAVQAFQKFKNDLWLADANKKLGIALVGAGQFKEAIAPLLLASKLFSRDFLRDQNEVDGLLAQALEKTNNLTEAVAVLNRYIEGAKVLNKERENVEFSKTMVSMGLQVEAERNKTLAAENQLQARELEQSKKIRLGLIGLFFLAILASLSLLLAVYRSRQARRAEMHMRRILRHIEQGILSINPALRIEPGYSHYLENLFGLNLMGADVVDKLFSPSHLSPADLSIVREVLSLAFSEGELTWDLNQHQLPNEIYLKGEKPRVLTLRWQIVCDQGSTIHSILLSVQDMTSERKLEERVQAELRKNDRLTSIFQELLQTDSRKLSKLLQDLAQLFAKLRIDLSQDSDAQSLRTIHTIKGIARTFNLRQLAEQAHECEDAFLQHKTKQAISSGQSETKLAMFVELFHEYQAIFSQIFGQEGKALSKQRTLLSSVEDIVPSLRQRVLDHSLAFKGISTQDFVLVWPPDLLNRLDAIFVHAFNNALDHGYIFPKDQGLAVRDVQFAVEAWGDDQQIHVTLRDWGQGLALAQLEKLAQTLGLATQDRAELTKLVFKEGVSTALHTTTTSGRGVGMSAIRFLCEEMGGSVQLHSNDPEPGARLELTFPKHAFTSESPLREFKLASEA